MSFPRAEENAELAQALRRVVGGEVRFDSYTRHLFSRDASMYAIEPIGVVFPRDAADVAAVVRRVLESRRPPRRVSVGKAGERAGLLAKRLLPFRAFEAAAKSSLGV